MAAGHAHDGQAAGTRRSRLQQQQDALTKAAPPSALAHQLPAEPSAVDLPRIPVRAARRRQRRPAGTVAYIWDFLNSELWAAGLERIVAERLGHAGVVLSLARPGLPAGVQGGPGVGLCHSRPPATGQGGGGDGYTLFLHINGPETPADEEGCHGLAAEDG
ncbi:hypothetical protein HRG_002840 [Hirsutella rhossiliensis]|uniref:Uncharacterized protein n=1 Tax=Hirsutella rhossiliensis TaxID=111463 RepID=A0A9P8N0X8_9HYPO|nr:uncharacterized protein HRG_02840 [Hirsutella rhossiliensis]KAH0964824.1 hypothetical protein HRG_02840 [Hirsutella rhossiliensis]